MQPWVAEVFPSSRKVEEKLTESKEEDERKTRAEGRAREEEKEINHKLQREPPNVALQRDLTGRGLAGGHTMQPAVLETPKVGPNSIVRVGS